MKKEPDRHCGVCSTPVFERNCYYYGKPLAVQDFQLEQDYFNQKRWLINRMVHGWGVVCGLDVMLKTDSRDTLIVTPGMALDCCGREILVCEPYEIELQPVLDECKTDPKSGKYLEPLVVCLEYHSRKTEPRKLPPIACDYEERCVHNRVQDSFRITVKPESEYPPEQDAEGQRIFICDPSRSLRENICNSLNDCPECGEDGCVILARLIPIDSPNIPENFPFLLEPCEDRKYVYSNQLLFEIIQCYMGREADDLPHIIDINWRDRYLQPDHTMSWVDFQDLVQNGLEVYFDRHMEGPSINEHSFLFSVSVKHGGSGYRVQRYVPAERIKYQRGKRRSRVIFKPDREWIREEIMAKNSEIAGGIDRVEITLRGSYICSNKGKALDGEFLGHNLPSGNGMAGGDFVSCFSVEPRS